MSTALFPLFFKHIIQYTFTEEVFILVCAFVGPSLCVSVDQFASEVSQKCYGRISM